MHDLTIFSIGSQRTRWLAASGATLAANIANADTPGFKAREVVSFDAALSAAGPVMARTSTGHLSPSAAETRGFDTVPRANGVGKHSGNTVALETELMAIGEVRSEHAKVTGIIGAFNRFLLSVSKG